jgi:hypothetical protein
MEFYSNVSIEEAKAIARSHGCQFYSEFYAQGDIFSVSFFKTTKIDRLGMMTEECYWIELGNLIFLPRPFCSSFIGTSKSPFHGYSIVKAL